MVLVEQFEHQNYDLKYLTLIIILIIVIKRNFDAAAALSDNCRLDVIAICKVCLYEFIRLK